MSDKSSRDAFLELFVANLVVVQGREPPPAAGSATARVGLAAFTRREAITGAFVQHATRARTPEILRGAPIRVPSCGMMPQHLGTAFDYLARFHVARTARQRGIFVHDSSWAAEYGLPRLKMVQTPRREATFWRQSVAEARAVAETYIAGNGDPQSLVNAAQILANADMLTRNPRMFDWTFRPLQALNDELLALLDIFSAQQALVPMRSCVLNPIFAAGSQIGGGDGDMVVDQRLIDFKTTAKQRVDQRDMVQVAGYAALQRIGGIILDGGAWTEPFASLGLYYARFGLLVDWTIDQMFPNNGFDAFCRVFEVEMKSV